MASSAELLPGRPAAPARLYASNLLCLLTLAALTLPIVFVAGGGVRLPWVLFVLWGLAVMVERRDTVATTMREVQRRLPELAAFGGWLFVVALNLALGRGYTGGVHLMTMVTVGIVVTMSVVHAGRRDGSYRWIAIGLCVLLGAEALRALPALVETFGLARMLMVLDPDPEVMAAAVRRGIGDYGNYTGQAMVLPVFLALGLTLRGWRRAALLVLIAAMAAAISLATFMGAFLILVLGLAWMTVAAVIRARNVYTSVAAAALPVVAAIVWMNTAGSTQQARFVLDKAADLWSSTREAGILEGETTGRSDLFTTSAATFAANPVFGIGPVTHRENPDLYALIGGHSSWVDQPAEYGIAGFMFFVVWILFASHRNRRDRRAFERSMPGLAMACRAVLPLFIVGGIVNPVVFILPVMVPFLFIGMGAADVLAAPAAVSSRASAPDPGPARVPAPA